MKLDKNTSSELNGRIFNAMFKLSGQVGNKKTPATYFYIDKFHLETNFITGEIIWTDGKSVDIYMLPYLLGDNIKVSIYIGEKLVVSESINVELQTKNILSGQWSTHDYVIFLINLSSKKILEFKNLIIKKI